MLIGYDFELERLTAFLAAMGIMPTFQPDGQTEAQVAVRKVAAEGVRTNFIDAEQLLTLKAGVVAVAWDEVHDWNVAIHGALSSIYRKDPASLAALGKVPTKDRIRDQIEKRAKSLLALWEKLPWPPAPYPAPSGPPPHHPAAFPGTTVLTFSSLLAGAYSLESGLPTLKAEFEKQQGLLHESQDAMHDFNVAARAQGAVQFTSGWQREVLDAIPSEPPELPPAKGEVRDVEAPGGPAITVQVSAPRASRYQLQGQGPGMADFVDLVADAPLVRIAVTLPAVGAWLLRVRGKNLKGEGDWSEDFPVTVPA